MPIEVKVHRRHIHQEQTQVLNEALRELKEASLTDNIFAKVRKGRGKEEKDKFYMIRLRKRYDRQLREMPNSRVNKWEA